MAIEPMDRWTPRDGGTWAHIDLVGRSVVGAGVPDGGEGLAYWLRMRLNQRPDGTTTLVPSKARELGEALIRMAELAERSFFVMEATDAD